MIWNTGGGNDERKGFPRFISGTLKQIIFMNRKNFLQQVAIGTGGIIAAPYILSGQTTPSKMPPKTDPLPAEKVKEFVSAGHNNIEKVKSLLKRSVPRASS